MTRTRLVVLFALAFLGASACLETAAQPQDLIRIIDISSQAQGPIRVKRIGVGDGDIDTLDIEVGGQSSFQNVNFRGDQLIVVWRNDGSYLGSTAIKASAAAQTGVSMQVRVGEGTVTSVLAQRPPGIGGQNGRTGPPPSSDQYSAKWGIYYKAVGRPGGTFGIQLTRDPNPNSPAAQLQFEPGDMIVTLDDLPIRKPADLEGHYSTTRVVFVNIRTGQPQAATVELP
jgi:hypothetical protein